jgi:hypothetical protein
VPRVLPGSTFVLVMMRYGELKCKKRLRHALSHDPLDGKLKERLARVDPICALCPTTLHDK